MQEESGHDIQYYQIMSAAGQGGAASRYTDGKWILEYVNPALCNLLCRPAENLIGKSMDDVILKEDLPRLMDARKKRLAGETTAYETRLVRSSGDTVYVQMTGAPRWLDGKVVGSILIITDLTERKHAEELLQESENKYRAIFENTGTAMLIVEEDTTISLANAELERITGYTKKEIEGKKSWTEFVVKEDLERMLVQHHIRRIDPSTAPKSYEFRLMDKSGCIKNMLLTVDMISGSKKSVASLMDITERKQIEFALKIEKEKAERYLNIAEVILVALDAQARITLLNRKGYRILGYEEGELIGKNWIETCICPNDHERVNEVNRKIITGEIEVFEYYESYVLTKNGEERFIAWHTTILKDDEGYITGTISSGEDITERKRAEEELIKSEDKFRKAFNSSPNIIGISTLADGRYIDINKNFEKVLGWSRDEVIGHTSQELDIFVDYSKRDDMADLLKRDGRICNYEANIKTKSGEVKIGEFSAEFVEVGGQKCLLAHVTDITERKRMEEAIKERENKYRRLFENSPMGIISVDIDGRITEVNERLVEVMDIHSVQATKQTNVLEFPPLIEAGFSDCFRRCLESGVSMSYEHPYVSKWNKPLHLRLKLNPICDATGLIIGAQGTVEDISDQKQAEEALTDSEMRYRTLAESAQDAIYRIAPDMRVMYVNSFAARLLGTEQEDIVGKPLDSLFPSKTMEIMAPRLLSVFHTGKPSSVENKITFYKGVMWQNTSLVPIKDPNGKVASILGVSRDITDRKLAEDKLVTSLREKEVLLKEVHHRVKNNLQIIYSLLNIEANYTRDEGTKNVLSECQGRVKSMALIHESLYRSEDLARVNFASYIRNLTTALFRSYNVDKKIIRSDLDLEEIFLGIDQAISFGLILNELVTNCLKHAFPNGRAGEIKIELLSCNDLIMLIIKDNGIGLPANSTSSQGSGSLGLKLVDSLVKQLKGTIETNLSKGTEFKITFPMS